VGNLLLDESLRRDEKRKHMKALTAAKAETANYDGDANDAVPADSGEEGKRKSKKSRDRSSSGSPRGSKRRGTAGTGG
jgi:hypothetical protein